MSNDALNSAALLNCDAAPCIRVRTRLHELSMALTANQPQRARPDLLTDGVGAGTSALAVDGGHLNCSLGNNAREQAKLVTVSRSRASVQRRLEQGRERWVVAEHADDD